ncbi:helix-turn-helix domain-containing protein [Testudinibacter sp. P27/CKL/0425]
MQQKRRECGYSAERLSELLDISQQQLSRYERGTNKINVSHLVSAANFLQTPISYFFMDCMLDSDWNSDQLDRHWLELNHQQKTAFVAFLETLHAK